METQVEINGEASNLYDALELVNGRIQVKEGTMIAKRISDGKGGITTEMVPVTDRVLAQEKVRVIALNQHLHGIYNKDDAGTIQKHALGRLSVQFRKWARPGWNKRFGSAFGKRFWNEHRASIDEGTYVTAMNFAKELISHKGNMFKNAQMSWQNLSVQERANVMRSIGELTFLTGATAMAFILAGMEYDEDDPVSGRAFASAMYATDRIKTELSVYIPLFWMNEGKKMLSTPIPAMSKGETVLKMFAHVLTLGAFDKDDAYFKGGRYYDERKISIWGKSLLPGVTQVDRLMYIQQSAEYYKLFNY